MVSGGRSAVAVRSGECVISYAMVSGFGSAWLGVACEETTEMLRDLTRHGKAVPETL